MTSSVAALKRTAEKCFTSSALNVAAGLGRMSADRTDKCSGDLGVPVVRSSPLLLRCSSGVAGSIPAHLSSFDSEPTKLL